MTPRQIAQIIGSLIYLRDSELMADIRQYPKETDIGKFCTNHGEFTPMTNREIDCMLAHLGVSQIAGDDNSWRAQ